MNFIVVMSDSLRSDYLEPGGSQWVKSPNAARFMESAAMFDNCWGGSFPTIPNRLDLMTGRYGEPIHAWLPLPYGEPNLPEIMRKNGYKTSLICDTPHLINGGHNFDYPFHQWEFIRGQEVDRFGMDDLTIQFPFNDASKIKTQFVNRAGSQFMRNIRGRGVCEEEWAGRKTYDTAIRWLEKNAKGGKFFLWIDGFDPHEPQLPPQKYIDMYDPGYEGQVFLMHTDGAKLAPEETFNVRARYAGTVTFIDRMFGRLLEALEDLKLSDDTCVVWVSDHGTMLGEHGKIITKDIRYHESARTHLMIRTPNRDSAGQHFKHLVQPCDLAPTLLELAGIDAPERMHGKSYLPLLQGKAFETRKVAITGHAGTNPFCGGKFPMIARSLKWTLVDYPEPERRELFDNENDPGQSNNIAEENQSVVAELHETILEFFRTHEAQPQLIRRFETGDPGDMNSYRRCPAGLEDHSLYFLHNLSSNVFPCD